jgi:hypothetical protein
MRLLCNRLPYGPDRRHYRCSDNNVTIFGKSRRVSVPDAPPVTDRVTDARVSERVRMPRQKRTAQPRRVAITIELDCHIRNKAAVDTVHARRLITHIRATSPSFCSSSLAPLHACATWHLFTPPCVCSRALHCVM